MIKKISPEVNAIDFNNYGSIVYLIQLKDKKILIDTSSKENSKSLVQYLKQLNILPKDIDLIILTHAHYDHIENVNLFSKAEIYGNFKESINENHSRTPVININPIEKLNIKEFTIYKTPGHTKEDIIILYKNILFSGDVIFHDGYTGRTDFPESMPERMKDSLKLIGTLKFDILCPGH
jgi:glyoxylase-like metal-dependent hydrolase (beta-lactamase superfamily II)